MRSVALWIALAAVGCGGKALKGPADGGDAGARPDAASPDAASPDAASPDALPDAASPDAICSSDPQCNDNPAMSALAGRCVPPELPNETSYCKCNDGFTPNLKTRRCRFGTFCVASKGDPWPTTVVLDHGDCAMRPGASCGAGGTQPGDLDVTVLAFAQEVCHLPDFYWLRVEMVGGCPSLMNLKGGGDKAPDPTVADCLVQKLSKQRWTCTGATDCSLVEHDTILP